jgi:hypothetical protein
MACHEIEHRTLGRFDRTLACQTYRTRPYREMDTLEGGGCQVSPRVTKTLPAPSTNSGRTGMHVELGVRLRGERSRARSTRAAV